MTQHTTRPAASTREMRTILRNMQFLSDRLERIERQTDVSAQWIEHVDKVLDYHWSTDKKNVRTTM